MAGGVGFDFGSDFTPSGNFSLVMEPEDVRMLLVDSSRNAIKVLDGEESQSF